MCIGTLDVGDETNLFGLVAVGLEGFVVFTDDAATDTVVADFVVRAMRNMKVEVKVRCVVESAVEDEEALHCIVEVVKLRG